MTADPLGAWFTHSMAVERFTGTGPYGDAYTAATTELAAVDDSTKLIRGADGSDVVSSTRIFLPSTTVYVPPGSRVTLPAIYGSRRTIVLAVSVHDGGGQPTPDHVELALQ